MLFTGTQIVANIFLNQIFQTFRIKHEVFFDKNFSTILGRQFQEISQFCKITMTIHVHQAFLCNWEAFHNSFIIEFFSYTVDIDSCCIVLFGGGVLILELLHSIA